MKPTVQGNGQVEEGRLEGVLTKGQNSQVMGPVNHGATNCQGNIQAIRSYADDVICPRKL